MRRIVRWQVRLALLVGLTTPAVAWTYRAAQRAQSLYDDELRRLDDAPYRDQWLAADTASRRADTLARMSEQDALLLEWGILMLGAVAALTTTSRIHRIAQFETLYVLLAPAAILLLGSVHQGIAFQRRVAYLASKGLIHPPAVMEYLQNQGGMLFRALACLAAFVVIFYLLIVFGGADPTEGPVSGEPKRKEAS